MFHFSLPERIFVLRKAPVCNTADLRCSEHNRHSLMPNIIDRLLWTIYPVEIPRLMATTSSITSRKGPSTQQWPLSRLVRRPSLSRRIRGDPSRSCICSHWRYQHSGTREPYTRIFSCAFESGPNFFFPILTDSSLLFSWFTRLLSVLIWLWSERNSQWQFRCCFLSLEHHEIGQCTLLH